MDGNELIRFIQDTNRRIGISLPEKWSDCSEVEIGRLFLQGLNTFLFQTYDAIGTTSFEGEEVQYFSEFHRYWEVNHEELLQPEIDLGRTRKASECLSKAVTEYGPSILRVTTDTLGLSPKAIAQARFLTANQDFRVPPEKAYGNYIENVQLYDPELIVADPMPLLRSINAVSSSQTDKRVDFAKNAAGFLVSRGIGAYDIAQLCNNDAPTIRDTLVAQQNMGYGLKKANMFVRDMTEFGVWPNLSGLDQIDVASDINTMKLALRTGILHTAMPLLSSFLDVFCWQYECIDHSSSLAWRKVWELWKSDYPSTAPQSPCSLDFLLYSIGRQYCKRIVTEFRCLQGHTHFAFGGRERYCPECRRSGARNTQVVVRQLLPCQVDPRLLPREAGRLLLPDNKLLRDFDGCCIFSRVCQPNGSGFVEFDPPKSISVRGRTGWTSSLSDRTRGGGGMMG
jgi:hypothetical protein